MNTIKIIVGLGNPGKQYQYTRHNIGFLVVDALAEKYGGTWRKKDEKEMADVTINGQQIILVKPQTFMNNSGKVIPALLGQKNKVENLLVVHDELEKPFGSVTEKQGGSHKGHNGLRSMIQYCGPDFLRIRCGVGRPFNKEEVPAYVLMPFQEDHQEVERMINSAVDLITTLLQS
jgi:PTH1 family peptidyl-tRNA hydrolase